MDKIYVPPLGWLARFADWVMIPVMYLVSGTLSESPQQTHFWNNIKLSHLEAKHLLFADMVHAAKSVGAYARFWWKIPIFHMPIFGGWTEYVVLEPASDTQMVWHVGWIAADVCGITRIELRGPVRLLLGPCSVSFFGIDAATGVQIPIRNIGQGVVGDVSSFASLPLV